jgi:hypothetical protein
MRLPLFGPVLFLVALAVVQSHPNVRRSQQGLGLTSGTTNGSASFGSTASSSQTNPDSSAVPVASAPTGNLGANGHGLSPVYANAATTGNLGADGHGLAPNYQSTVGAAPAETQVSTTPAGTPAAASLNEAVPSGGSNGAGAPGGSDPSAVQANNPSSLGSTGTPAATQEMTPALPAETTPYGTTGGTGTPAATQETTPALPAETTPYGTTGGTGAPAATQQTTPALPAETSPSGTTGAPETNPGDADVDAAIVETRPGITIVGSLDPSDPTAAGNVMMAPTLSPTRDIDAAEVDTLDPTSAPTVDPDDFSYSNSNSNPTPNTSSSSNPWDKSPEKVKPAPYDPPAGSDPFDEAKDEEVEDEWEEKTVVEIAEEDFDEAIHDKYVPIVAGIMGGIGLLLMIVVAQQMVENPDGLFAKICRCSVACFRCLCWPCRMLFCCGGSRAKARRTHDRVMNDGDNYGYTHDLELT